MATDFVGKGVEFFKWVVGIDRTLNLQAASSLDSRDEENSGADRNMQVARGESPAQSTAVIDDAKETLFCSKLHELPRNGSRLDARWRLALYYALLDAEKTRYKQPKLWRDACSFDQLFQTDTLRIVPKSSASDTVLLMGILRPPFYGTAPALRAEWSAIKCDVVLKVSFPALERNYSNSIDSIARVQKDGLACEIELYELASQLVIEKVTPNFVLGLAHWDCANVATIVSNLNPSISAEMQSTARRIAQRNKIPYDAYRQPVSMLLLERGRGASLAESYLRFSDEQMLSIVFQIVYTLNCMNRRLIRHADLHCGNVFIDVLDTAGSATAVNYVLRDGDTYFHVPMLNHVAKIYDWDFGGVYASRNYEMIASSASPPVQNAWPAPKRIIVNSKSSSAKNCLSMSTCAINDKADVFTVLSNLYYMIMDSKSDNRFPIVLAFIRRHIDQRLLDLARVFENAGGFQYRLCSGVFNEPCALTKQSSKSLQKSAPATARGAKCSGAWEPADCHVSTPEQMLYDEVWGKWRRSTRAPLSPENKTPYIYGDWTNAAQRDYILSYFNKL